VVEVESAEQANHLINEGVAIAYDLKMVERFDPKCRIIQCFKCQRYGHTSTHCTNKQKCGHCEGKSHSRGRQHGRELDLGRDRPYREGTSSRNGQEKSIALTALSPLFLRVKAWCSVGKRVEDTSEPIETRLEIET